MVTDLALWTVQAVESRLEDFFEEMQTNWHDREGAGSWYDIKWQDGVPCEIPGLGTLKYVDDYGGEGQGDEYWVVFSITQGDVTRNFKKQGGYASFAGGEFDGDLTETFPEERTIIVWA